MRREIEAGFEVKLIRASLTFFLVFCVYKVLASEIVVSQQPGNGIRWPGIRCGREPNQRLCSCVYGVIDRASFLLLETAGAQKSCFPCLTS